MKNKKRHEFYKMQKRLMAYTQLSRNITPYPIYPIDAFSPTIEETYTLLLVTYYFKHLQGNTVSYHKKFLTPP